MTDGSGTDVRQCANDSTTILSLSNGMRECCANACNRSRPRIAQWLSVRVKFDAGRATKRIRVFSFGHVRANPSSVYIGFAPSQPAAGGGARLPRRTSARHGESELPLRRARAAPGSCCARTRNCVSIQKLLRPDDVQCTLTGSYQCHAALCGQDIAPQSSTHKPHTGAAFWPTHRCEATVLLRFPLSNSVSGELLRSRTPKRNTLMKAVSIDLALSSILITIAIVGAGACGLGSGNAAVDTGPKISAAESAALREIEAKFQEN